MLSSTAPAADLTYQDTFLFCLLKCDLISDTRVCARGKPDQARA
jgi:hypothetical protein